MVVKLSTLDNFVLSAIRIDIELEVEKPNSYSF